MQPDWVVFSLWYGVLSEYILHTRIVCLGDIHMIVMISGHRSSCNWRPLDQCYPKVPNRYLVVDLAVGGFWH